MRRSPSYPQERHFPPIAAISVSHARKRQVREFAVFCSVLYAILLFSIHTMLTHYTHTFSTLSLCSSTPFATMQYLFLYSQQVTGWNASCNTLSYKEQKC